MIPVYPTGGIGIEKRFSTAIEKKLPPNVQKIPELITLIFKIQKILKSDYQMD